MSNIKSYRSSADALIESEEEGYERNTKTPPEITEDEGDQTIQNDS